MAKATREGFTEDTDFELGHKGWWESKWQGDIFGRGKSIFFFSRGNSIYIGTDPLGYGFLKSDDFLRWLEWEVGERWRNVKMEMEEVARMSLCVTA